MSGGGDYRGTWVGGYNSKRKDINKTALPKGDGKENRKEKSRGGVGVLVCGGCWLLWGLFFLFFVCVRVYKRRPDCRKLIMVTL